MPRRPVENQAAPFEVHQIKRRPTLRQVERNIRGLARHNLSWT
jgi:hypothetical protein